MGLGGVAIATLPSVIFPKLMFSDRLGGKYIYVHFITFCYCLNIYIGKVTKKIRHILCM